MGGGYGVKENRRFSTMDGTSPQMIFIFDSNKHLIGVLI
jgi:hypothetical protein